MATQTAEQPAAIQFGGVTPVLRVNSVAHSIAYYVRVLGFNIGFLFPNPEQPFFASVSRGHCSIFLCEGDQGHPGAWVWIDGVDVDKVCDEYKASGAKIRNPPTNYEWAREMQVEDLDGNVLRIGSEPKKDEPIGDWLDMNGVRWRSLPEGGYKQVEP